MDNHGSNHEGSNNEASYLNGNAISEEGIPYILPSVQAVVNDADGTSLTPTDNHLMSYRIKLIKTSCMLVIYVGMGAWAGIVTPTLVDMVELYNCSTEEFVHAYTFKAVGVMGGSFLGASIADRLRPQADLWLFIANLIGGVTIAAAPWAPSLALMASLFFINGLAHGTINVVCSSLNIAIWGEAAPRPIHALHMMFTLGLTIGPPLTIPFLSSDPNNQSNSTLTNYPMPSYNSWLAGWNLFNGGMVAVDDHTTEDFLQNQNISNTNITSYTQVRIPYMLFGGWSVLISVVFLIFFLCSSTYTSKTVKRRESILEMLNPAKVAGGNFKFGLFFVIVIFFLYIFIQGRDRLLAVFIFIMANKSPLNISKPLSALLVTCFNLCTAFGRGLSGVLSKWVPVHILLFSQLIVACIIQVLLVLFGLSSTALFCSLICLSALFMGPTYPLVMSWCDRYIEATGVVIAIIDLGIGTGSFISLWLGGSLNQKHGSESILIFDAILGGCVLTILIPLQIVSHIKGDRHKIISHNKSINDCKSETNADDTDPLIP